MEVDGDPAVEAESGDQGPNGWVSDSGADTAALVFAYEVADGDEDTGGVSIEAGRIALNGGTIEDEADNDPPMLDHQGAVAARRRGTRWTGCQAGVS